MLWTRLRRYARPWTVLPLAGLIVLGGWWLIHSHTTSDAATTSSATTRVVAATTGTVAETVSASGTVAAAQTANLNFGSSGVVTAVDVKAGQAVTTGEVLAQINSAQLQANLASADSSLAAAQARLADDESSGASSAQITADSDGVTTAQDNVTSATAALNGATLVATFNGTVAQVNITVGESVGSGGTGATSLTGGNSGSGVFNGPASSSSSGIGANNSNSSTSSPDIQVVTPTSFTVSVGFTNADISKIAVNQKATITLSTSTGNSTGFPFGGGGGIFGGGGGIFGGGGLGGASSTGDTSAASNVAPATGTVTSVGAVAQSSSGVAKFPVSVAFQDSSGGYSPGATVNVSITYAEQSGVVEVPLLAVTTQNGVSTVTVQENGVRSTRTVTTGLTSGSMIAITSGLSKGEDVVVTVPSAFTRPGGGTGRFGALSGSGG